MSEVQSASVEVKARSASVSDADFIKAIIAANGEKTNQEVADSLGMKLGSFNTRYSVVTNRLSEDGVSLPGLKRRAGAGRAKSKLTADAVKELLKKMQEPAKSE